MHVRVIFARSCTFVHVRVPCFFSCLSLFSFSFKCNLSVFLTLGLILVLIALDIVFDKSKSHTHDWFEIYSLPIPCVEKYRSRQLPELFIGQPLDKSVV